MSLPATKASQEIVIIVRLDEGFLVTQVAGNSHRILEGYSARIPRMPFFGSSNAVRPRVGGERAFVFWRVHDDIGRNRAYERNDPEDLGVEVFERHEVGGLDP